MQARITRDQAIGGRLFVLRKGSKQNHLVKLFEADVDSDRVDGQLSILSEHSA